MSKALRASALILLLACSARAGWMPYGSPEPPPPAQSALQEETKDTADGDTQGESAKTLTGIVMSLLSGVGSLF